MKLSILVNSISYIDEDLVYDALTFQSVRKRRIYGRIVAAASLLLMVGVSICISGFITLDQSMGHKPTRTTAPIRVWDELQIYEKYSCLYLDGGRYSSTAEKCSDKLGQLIGEYIMEGMEGLTGIKHEKTVKIYEIAGVSKAFAVAAQYDEAGECYACHNSSYRADSYGQFAKDSQIEKYLKINRIYLYDNDGNTYVSEGEISSELLLDSLFSGEDIPMFLSEDFPAEFFAGKKEKIEYEEGGAATKPYILNPKKISDEIKEFCMDKELGERIVKISVDYTLFAEKNVGFDIYSGGFVSTNIAYTGKIFYINKEKVGDFVSELKENLKFVEKGSER